MNWRGGGGGGGREAVEIEFSKVIYMEVLLFLGD